MGDLSKNYLLSIQKLKIITNFVHQNQLHSKIIWQDMN